MLPVNLDCIGGVHLLDNLSVFLDKIPEAYKQVMKLG
jgi:hypothetical protein